MTVLTVRDSCDIGFRVQFNVEFPRQVMNFPIIDIDVLEIRSNLNKFEKTIAEPSTANTRKVFFRVEPLAPPTEKRPHENSG